MFAVQLKIGTAVEFSKSVPGTLDHTAVFKLAHSEFMYWVCRQASGLLAVAAAFWAVYQSKVGLLIISFLVNLVQDETVFAKG